MSTQVSVPFSAYILFDLSVFNLYLLIVIEYWPVFFVGYMWIDFLFKVHYVVYFVFNFGGKIVHSFNWLKLNRKLNDISNSSDCQNVKIQSTDEIGNGRYIFQWNF